MKTPENSCKPVRSLMKWSPDMSANWPKAATFCRAPWRPTSASSPTAAPSIDGLVAGQVEKIAEGRAVLTKALENDIIGIKGVIENHSAKLAEDRTELSKALENDLSGIRGLLSDHSNRLADDRGLLVPNA